MASVIDLLRQVPHLKKNQERKIKRKKKQHKKTLKEPQPLEENAEIPLPIYGEEELEAKSMGFHVSIPGIFILNGKPGSGKSHLMKYVFYINRDKFRLGLAVSGTYHDPANLDFVPALPEYRMTRYDGSRVRWLLNEQAKIPKEVRKPAYFIADDYISDRNMWEDQAFQDMCTQCRHFDIFVCINTQYINKVPPLFRESAFQTAIFKQDTKRSIDAAYESYGNGFDTVNDFKRFNKQQLASYEFLFIDKFHPEGNTEDSRQIFQSPEHIPSFKLWDHVSAKENSKVLKKNQRKSKKRKRK